MRCNSRDASKAHLWHSLLSCSALLCGCHFTADTGDYAARFGRAGPEASDGESVAAAQAEEIADLAELASLAEDRWVAIAPQTAIAPPSDDHVGCLRWHHPGIAKLSATESTREKLRHALTVGNPILATDAAIALARQDDAAGAHILALSVANSALSDELRQAAAEALGGLPSEVARPNLEVLLADETEAPAGAVPLPDDVRAELVRAAVPHLDERLMPAVAAGLQSKSVAVRLAAVQALSSRGSDSVEIDERLATMCSDLNSDVRAATIVSLAERDSQQALDAAKGALDDSDLDVMLAAAAALGRLRGDRAHELLVGVLESDSPAMRCAAVAALATHEDFNALKRAADDPSWSVRRQTAATLAELDRKKAVEIVDRLLADPHHDVRARAIESLRVWPLADALASFERAMQSKDFATRSDAAAALAQRWEPAREFAADAPAADRTATLAALGDAWSKGNAGATSGGASRRSGIADESFGATAGRAPSQFNRDGRSSESTSLLKTLESATATTTRREAAQQLASLAHANALDDRQLARLNQTIAAQNDPDIWCDALRVTRGDRRAVATLVAYSAIDHSSPVVRRLACDCLGQVDPRRHAEILIRSLTDDDTRVVRAAVAALAAPEALDDPAPLERLLTTPDTELRLEVAYTLAVIGAESGPSALVALARDDDPAVRREAARAMSQLEDQQFAATMVELLDDEALGVRIAALDCLTRITGRDVASDSDDVHADLSQLVARWLAWWEEEGRQAFTAGREPPARG